MSEDRAVIEITDLKKTFDGRQALAGISLTVRRGEIFGYLGANGAGKTTTIRILLDLLRADSGRALVLGEPTEKAETRRRIGFVLDADGLYDRLSAEENLAFYAGLYGIGPDAARIENLLAWVGLSGRDRDRAGTYSKGMRRRLALARALVHDPSVLILDEPMSGIDPSGQIELRAVIQRLVRERGMTILLSSHDLDEVERLCSRIALIDRGTILLEGPLKELLDRTGEGRLRIETTGPVAPELVSQLRARLGIEAVETPESGTRSASLELTLPDGVGNAEVVSFLASRGVGIERVESKHASLEELYAGIVREREASR